MFSPHNTFDKGTENLVYINGIVTKRELLSTSPNDIYKYLRTVKDIMKFLSNGGILAISQPWENLLREV